MSRTPAKIHTSTDRPLWIDFNTRHREIVALARRQPEWRELIRRGWDEHDLSQEILVRVWERQETRQAYDGVRSGFAKYITVITGSIMRNLLEKRRTLKATSEQVGAVLVEDGERIVVDAALIAVGELKPELSRAGRARVARALRRAEEAEGCVKPHGRRPRG